MLGGKMMIDTGLGMQVRYILDQWVDPKIDKVNNLRGEMN